ncbi:hypothetical protein AVEN_255383-1, partial [Araneus ventricosus]
FGSREMLRTKGEKAKTEDPGLDCRILPTRETIHLVYDKLRSLQGT